jgi:hypothetical protein
VGSNLQVYPIAGAVPCAREAGARFVIVNAQPTAFDNVAVPRFLSFIRSVESRLRISSVLRSRRIRFQPLMPFLPLTVETRGD